MYTCLTHIKRTIMVFSPSTKNVSNGSFFCILKHSCKHLIHTANPFYPGSFWIGQVDFDWWLLIDVIMSIVYHRLNTIQNKYLSVCICYCSLHVGEVNKVVHHKKNHGWMIVLTDCLLRLLARYNTIDRYIFYYDKFLWTLFLLNIKYDFNIILQLYFHGDCFLSWLDWYSSAKQIWKWVMVKVK